MTLTKDRIIESLYKNTDLMKSEAAQTFQSLIEIMKQTLSSGEDILVSGFGKFCVKEKKERKGRNPATGNDMILESRRVVTFKWSGKRNRNRENDKIHFRQKLKWNKQD